MDITTDRDFWKMRITSLSSLLSTVGCSLVCLARHDR